MRPGVEQVRGRDGRIHTRLVDPSPASGCSICPHPGGGELGLGLHLIDGQAAGVLCDRCWYVLKMCGFDADELRDAAKRAEERRR
jgi:hypothetical protein